MTTTLLSLDTLLAPIEGAHGPAGADPAYGEDYAAIKEARRADDPGLAQGEWTRAPKLADWPRVQELATAALASRSKDLQIAAWLAEAAAELHGFAGLAEGLTLIRRLLETHWDTLHPGLADGPDGRIGRIEWLRANLPQVIRRTALTTRDAGGYGLLHYDEMRATENLGRRDAEAMRQAIDAGKLGAEGWQRAVGVTPTAFYEPIAAGLAAARTALALLAAEVDRRFGADAPSLAEIDRLLAAAGDLVGRILKERGRIGVTGTTTTEPPPVSTSRPVSTLALSEASGPLTSREDALRRLNEVALYFRRTEPHSPVAYLCEKAAEWAQMPFDRWLETVIKDEGSLNHVRELLGIKIP